MSNDKFRYHRHLKTIAEKDVEYLLWKDRQYGASWKESGRSAWFMVKRMIDRLVNMMARPPEPANFRVENVENLAKDVAGASHLTNVPETGVYMCGLGGGIPETMTEHLRYLLACHTSEDLLAKVQAEGLEGQDGTVLAVLRDLRRYALLVEAEITERLSEKPALPTLQIPTETLDGWPMKAVPVEDSNRHADRLKPSTGLSQEVEGKLNEMRGLHWPWSISEKNIEDSGMSSDEVGAWWTKHTPTRWILVPFVESGNGNKMPEPLWKAQVYTKLREGAVLDIAKCPPALRSSFPKFRMEVNLKELNDMPKWSKVLYDWIEAEGKYRLKAEHKSWANW